MKTSFDEAFLRTDDGRRANEILRSCVHCGFCNATCPTYQITGDELDGPRGRIYQIKEMLENSDASESTMLHLDRCLTCRNCETTCPSGVQYAELLDIGRTRVEQEVERDLFQSLGRDALRYFLLSFWFPLMLRIGRVVRPITFGQLRRSIPLKNPVMSAPSTETHQRSVMLIEGCVQPSLQPSIDSAAIAIFDQVGLDTITTEAVCCGAIDHHLSAEEAAMDRIRRNIDTWLPRLGEVEAITMTATGCGVTIRDYARLLQHDPDYSEKARRISDAYRDPIEIIDDIAPGELTSRPPRRIAFHPPCTLQHGQKLSGAVEDLLTRVGFELMPFAETHLCCGSAGTYSITQRALSHELRDRKLQNISSTDAELIVTANIGCQTHLQSGSDQRVIHWLELLVS